MTRLAYADSSALVKLVVAEPESAAAHRWFVEADEVACSRVALVEVARAAGRGAHDAAHLDWVLAQPVVVELDPQIASLAASLAPPSLRTLDAIHLATALVLRPDLDAFVTYDDRLADAARGLGLPVVCPA